MLGACKWCVDRLNIECRLFALSMEPGCKLRSARFCINSKCFFIAKTYGLNHMISQIRGHTQVQPRLPLILVHCARLLVKSLPQKRGHLGGFGAENICAGTCRTPPRSQKVMHQIAVASPSSSMKLHQLPSACHAPGAQAQSTVQ